MSNDLQVLARFREPVGGDPPVVAVRWAFHAERDFPEHGFTLTRTSMGNAEIVAQDLRLPGAIQTTGGTWQIDLQELEADRLKRSATPYGPTLPGKLGAASLSPALAFALANPDPQFLSSQLEAVAKMLGESHLGDLELDSEHWHGNPVPDYPKLRAMANGTPDEQDIYEAVVRHYQRRTKAYLAYVATHFGMAKFLGLGIEDVPPDGMGGTLDYLVTANWPSAESSSTRAVDPDSGWPAKPIRLRINQADTAVGYPPYGRFYGSLAKWKPARPPSDVGGTSPDDETLFSHLVNNAMRGPRVYPAPLAHIEWDAQEPEGNVDEPAPLLTREAHAWRIERQVLGKHTAVEEFAPAIDPSMAFEVCHDGEMVLRTKDLFFEDDVDLPYGESPLEGWNWYCVAGIDLFGIAGPMSDPAPVRLLDKYAPPPPIVRIEAERVEFPAGNPGSVMVGLEWDGLREYMAPDTAQFRLRQTWIAVRFFALAVTSVIPITGSQAALNSVQVDISLADGQGAAIDQSLLKRFVGGTLLTADGEFAVLGIQGADTIRVRRSAGRAPAVGDGSLRYADAAIESPSQFFQRRPPRVGAVRVATVSPLVVELLDENDNPIVPGVGRIHFHLLNESFAVEPEGSRRGFAVRPPGPTEVLATAVFIALMSLPAGEMEAFLAGSPGLFLPGQVEGAALYPPDGFVTGTLQISTHAVDGHGNESEKAEAIVVASAHAEPTGPEWVERLWAKDSAEYVDQASVSLAWPAMANAVRYDLERALEAALGCTPLSSDDQLASAARAPSNHGAFSRITSSAFLPRHADHLPGRAPTRAIYRVRGVSAAGVHGGWILVALVRVPDVRIPAKPALLGVRPHPTEERTFICTWTQAGAPAGIGFAVELRHVASDSGAEGRWERVVDFLPNGIGADPAGRFTAAVGRRPPGRWQEVRIIPVRHALDPDDPRAILTRRIEGEPSNVMRGRANGDLRAPAELRASVSHEGRVVLNWRNEDEYEQLELRRRAPDSTGFARRLVGGDTETFQEPKPLLSKGTWTYELVGIGVGRRATSQRAIAIWGDP
ncbi:hypothetical protein GR200_30955 [Rhizobium leguminosarum]|uniref:hypothetical protein n=1 Tax=Rhizobium leguminosarum TaxID=384 RepID=UPI0013BD81B7|nr:hypothetical protein [Rhizobium leguminosarum]NEI59451.1 hypothetical protein [Rhizobium leguminosarum]NEI88291.1 hypothetical protein [Rhizobium leguminosarum]